MKKLSIMTGAVAAMLAAAWLTAGCTSNMLGGATAGAATGAVGSSLVGALTDLIVDGQVDTYRLSRNLVGGAVAGGMAGAAAGHHKDVVEGQQKQPPQPARQPAVQPPDKELIAKIGNSNYAALNDLLQFKHESAYRHTLKAARNKQSDIQEAALAIQALIDLDRGNAAGRDDAIARFLELNDTVTSEKEALKGLKQLHAELKNERAVQGIRPPT